jgi:predicted RNA-binding Zn-ribbon protein involved in translation (DUF1610 family)
MTKTRNAKPKPPTHFEQVPLPVVKKVIAEAVKPAKTGAKNVIVDAAPARPSLTALPARSIARPTVERRRNRLKVPPCPECESHRTDIVCREQYVLYARCPDCGHVWAVARPGQKLPGQSTESLTSADSRG